MKKLMIALTAVAMAAVAQAATYNWTWGVGSTSPIAKPGTTGSEASDFIGSGTAYLFADLTAAQLSTIVSDFAANNLTLTGYEQTTDVTTGGAITKVSWDDSRTAGTDVNWYMIVEATIGEDEYLFVSDVLTKSRQADGKNTKVTFNVLDDSKAAAMLASDGYNGAGWYAVPEPTSGLLLLLGMAGLALRRKQK